jgi:hypothetical protein
VAVLARNHEIVRTNLVILAAWVAGEPAVPYLKPKSGTTALLKFDTPMSSRDFCTELI